MALFKNPSVPYILILGPAHSARELPGWGPALPIAWPGAAHCNLEFAVEARRCPLQSGAPCWGLALPAAIWSSMLKSGENDGENDGEEKEGEGQFI